ncbi:MAG: ATP-binding cassette domain-containing protein [Clostridiales bacterium]|nr:ATP-binding cassette domain-containing protein [Clostridiales bacterium]
MSQSITSQKLVILKDLKKYYPERGNTISRNSSVVHAVDGVDLEIASGETLGIVGESGCGKSTIGRQIVALETPTSGQIFFDGHEISNMSEKKLKNIRTQVQMVFQDSDTSLNPRKQVFDILAAPLLYHKMVKKDNLENEIIRLVDLVGLSKNSAQKYPHEFSGGQRQRIGIAKALSLNPKLIICDEPVSALDVSVQAQILNLFKQLQKELNLTYLFIGHGLGAVNYVSDRIAVMYLGKIMEIADAKTLFENPKHPYTQALIDASPVAEPNQRFRERIVLTGEMPSIITPPMGCRFHTRCPYVQDSCKRTEPKLEPVAYGSSHLSACPVRKEKSLKQEII